MGAEQPEAGSLHGELPCRVSPIMVSVRPTGRDQALFWIGAMLVSLLSNMCLIQSVSAVVGAATERNVGTQLWMSRTPSVSVIVKSRAQP